MKLNELEYKEHSSYSQPEFRRKYFYEGYWFSFTIRIFGDNSESETGIECDLWVGTPYDDPFDAETNNWNTISLPVKEVFKKIDAGEENAIPEIVSLFNWLKNEALLNTSEKLLKIAEDMRKVAKSL